MSELVRLGKTIKEVRLSKNLRMDDVAKKANITRATLWSIENGSGNCSISSVLKVLEALDLSFNVEGQLKHVKRERATRANTSLDKKINRFVIMCVEQYSLFINRDSKSTYGKMKSKNIISELTSDYEDFHGMSFEYLNEYINSQLGDQNESTTDEHSLAKTLLITKVTELIANKYKVSISEARDMLYSSRTIELIDDDEIGLYGESPLYVLSIFEKEKRDEAK